jgi:hypothetical protein
VFLLFKASVDQLPLDVVVSDKVDSVVESLDGGVGGVSSLIVSKFEFSLNSVSG